MDLKLDEADFMNVPSVLEVAEEAPILIILNLAIEEGIMNGTRGVVNTNSIQKT